MKNINFFKLFFVGFFFLEAAVNWYSVYSIVALLESCVENEM